jgi:RES domain-containing protein
MASRSRKYRPLRAFRIGDARHPLFDGAGAYLKGGRWNSPGKRIIYAAETYAGALLEALVHLNFDEVPDNYSWIEILLSQTHKAEELGADQIEEWNSNDLTITRKYGDRWYEEKRTPALLVPSVVTAGVERNVLINQDHPRFAGIRSSEARDVIWNQRLFQG